MRPRLYEFLAAAATAIVLRVPAVTAKPEQIRAVQEPIFHFYLQAYPGDPTIPVMGPEASSEYFEIGSPTPGTIQSTNSSAYLNIVEDTASYKTLVFAAEGEGDGEGEGRTDAWALEGDTIITSTASAYGRQLNFLACRLEGAADFWQVYLQMGSDIPADRTCSNFQSLHLPCLC
ncbi:hypothetical protein F5X99DRAFT_403750 [Biscogniauxia marginata]|nr:hypothetical protein F5X99DRAFT_403750 [Biscogniauxia marginata]